MSTVTTTAQDTASKRTNQLPVRWMDWAKSLPGILPWAKKRALAQAAEEIRFKPNGFLTLGVEIELNLIDPLTGDTQNRSDEVLKAAAQIKKIHPEFWQDMIEINTGICQDVHAVEADLKSTFASLKGIGESMGLGFITTGRHPTTDTKNLKVYDNPRYHAVLERVRWLLHRSVILGLHVHIGMGSAQECIRYNNFFLHFLPHLLVLSASSPYWQEEDTGLFSSRPSVYESIPTAGQPNILNSWAEFEELYWSMKAAGAIGSLKDLWWDVRPSPKYGTMEIRVCDGVATLSETLAIVAFIHLLAHWFADHLGWLDQIARPPQWVGRENKWRAMRYGLSADLVTSADGHTRPLREDIEEWLVKLAPYAERLGYREHMHTLRQILDRGPSAVRQRAIFAKTKDLKEVVRFNLREFMAGTPLWEELEERAPQLESKPPENAAPLPAPELKQAAG